MRRVDLAAGLGDEQRRETLIELLVGDRLDVRRAFFGAWLSYGAAALADAAVLALGTELPAATVFGEYAPYFLYLALGEATVTVLRSPAPPPI